MKLKMLSKAVVFENYTKNDWTKVFSLLPVRISGEQLVWLEHVERKVEKYWRNDNLKYRWVYREIMCPRAREAMEVARREVMLARRRATQGMEDMWEEVLPVDTDWGVPIPAEPQVDRAIF